jgi:hypothetical protein
VTKDTEKGMAFVFEGQTEKVFYTRLLKHFVSRRSGYTIENRTNGSESYYQIGSDHDKKPSIIVKMHTVGAITQVPNSGTWFNSFCLKKHRGINWSVFLCYDMDSYNDDITKFHEGDWLELRKSLMRPNVSQIIDLAARADIEDIFLYDMDSVCEFLGISNFLPLSGRKGKVKLKGLYRQAGKYYHEGERAADLINALNMDTIVHSSPIPFGEIDAILQE